MNVDPPISTPQRNRKAFRVVFYVGGLVATSAGTHTVVAGGKSVPGQSATNRALESELRFYAAFYAAYGIFLLRLAGRADRDGQAVRGAAGALLFAGFARAGGWVAVGRPQRLQIALLAVELLAPPAIVTWQARLQRLGG